MKVCAACHTDLPKESYSKKQWKLDQRRCKVCTSNNRMVQPASEQDNDNSNTNEVIKALDSMCMNDVEKISDEELFKKPPPAEDCPICFLQIPTLITGWRYNACCGKVICSGCCHAPVYDNQGNEVDNEKCPFCRTPWPESDEEHIERLNKRAEAGDAHAVHSLGWYYDKGINGSPQNHVKALELYHRAAELGHANAYTNVGYSYSIGRGVERDKKKAVCYYKLATMRGDVYARHNLGCVEKRANNMDTALKHFMIAVRGGKGDSLNKIKELYSNGHVTKEDYTKALLLYQTYLSEIKNKQRDEAASYNSEEYRYY